MTGPDWKNPGVWCLREKPLSCLSSACNHRPFPALPLPAQDLSCRGEVGVFSHGCPGPLCQLEGAGWPGLGAQKASGAAGLSQQLVPACLELRVQRGARSGSLCGIPAATFFPVPAHPFAHAHGPASFPQARHLWAEAGARPQHVSPFRVNTPRQLFPPNPFRAQGERSFENVEGRVARSEPEEEFACSACSESLPEELRQLL